MAFDMQCTMETGALANTMASTAAFGATLSPPRFKKNPVSEREAASRSLKGRPDRSNCCCGW